MDLCLTGCNLDVGSPNLYTGEVIYPYYQYYPSLVAAKVFLALFTAISVYHICLTVYRRTWWALFTICLGACLEAIGWGGRLWSSTSMDWNPTYGGRWNTAKGGFVMQIVCLIIAPTFFSAANYIFLGRLVRRTDRRYSSITPSSFSVVFTFADFICLLIQCIGGGQVGTASDGDQMQRGLNTMSVGVILQLVVTVIYCIMLAEFAWRHARKRPAQRQFNLLGWTKWVCCCCQGRRKNKNPALELEGTSDSEKGDNVVTPAGSEGGGSTVSSRMVTFAIWTLVATTLMIAVRSIFRCVELLGFSPTDYGIYADEKAFIALDAAIMFALLVIYAIFHPGWIDGRRLF
ncbi:hypothetical protein IAT38_003875 [Cryptococcus sp. DSM 104549]